MNLKFIQPDSNQDSWFESGARPKSRDWLIQITVFYGKPHTFIINNVKITGLLATLRKSTVMPTRTLQIIA